MHSPSFFASRLSLALHNRFRETHFILKPQDMQGCATP
jgi:hypothetical protein